MEQLTLEQRACNYAEMLYPGKGAYYTCIKDGYIAGAEWQKEQVIDILLLAAHFVMNATPQKWDIDHYKEKFIALLKPIQDQNIKLLQD